MGKFELKNGARLAAAAGLGLTLALGAAPVVALADGADAPAVQQDADVIEIESAEDLASAIAGQMSHESQIWNLEPGEYDLDEECLAKYATLGADSYTQGNWYFPIIKDNITINGNGATITSSVKSDNGAWSTQNFITVFGDNVTINNVNIESKVETNKAIEVLGDNFMLSDSNILPTDDGNSGSIYFNHDGIYGTSIHATIKNVTTASWISTGTLQEDDGVTLDGVTIDFSNNPYAADASDGYFPVRNNVTVGESGLTVKVGSSLDDFGVVTKNLPAGSTLELTGDVTVHTAAYVSSDDVTINGNGHKIIAADDLSADTAYSQQNSVLSVAATTDGVKTDGFTIKDVTIVGSVASKHALNLYDATNVIIGEGVVLDHTKSATGAPLVLNASTATVTGDLQLVTGEGSWYAANLDNADGDAKFEVADGANLSILGPKAAVFAEDNGSETGHTMSVDLGDNMVAGENGVYTLSIAKIGDKNYPTIEAALNAAEDGDVITLAPGEHKLAADQCIVVDKLVTIQGAADGTTVITGSGVTDYGNGLFTFTSGSEGSVLENLTVNYTATGAQRAAVYFDGGFTDGSAEMVTKIKNVHFKGSDDLENEKALAVSSTYTNGGFVEITGCTIENFAYGMYFNGIHHLTVRGNTISGTKYNGINIAGDRAAFPCTDVVIENNTLANISTAGYEDDTYSSGINIGANSSVTIGDNAISMENNKKPINLPDVNKDLAVVTYRVDGVDYATFVSPVNEGKVEFTEPDAPTKSGYTFSGWTYGNAEVSVEGGIVTISVSDGGVPDDGYVFTANFTKNSSSNPSTPAGDAVKVEQSEGGKVTVDPSRADEGDEVTVTVAPDEGRELRGLTVTDSEGNAVEVRAGEKDGEFVFTMPDGAVTVSAVFGCDGGASCPTHGFSDVDQSRWYHDAIDWAVTNKVLNGYGDGGELMGPFATITRVEMAQVLWNRAGRPEATADLSQFADVDAQGWYADPVAWCLSEGIFRGYGDTFGTERPISREEVATVLWRLSGSPEADSDLSSFSDSASVSEYATGALAWAVGSGVVAGKDDGTKLDPQGVCTRAEVAAMLMRLSAE